MTDVGDFVGTLERVAAGGSALDPEVVSRLLAGAREEHPLHTLTDREREVLELVAEGRSNRGIGERLAVTERAVQKHVTSIFAKLALPPTRTTTVASWPCWPIWRRSAVGARSGTPAVGGRLHVGGRGRLGPSVANPTEERSRHADDRHPERPARREHRPRSPPPA